MSYKTQYTHRIAHKWQYNIKRMPKYKKKTEIYDKLHNYLAFKLKLRKGGV